MKTVVHEFAELAIRRIRNDQQELRVKLGKGGARDYSEYQDLCGQIAGMDKACDQITITLQAVREVDDKDGADE